jgi:capsule polysaccharide export protein KpsE/RkpR
MSKTSGFQLTLDFFRLLLVRKKTILVLTLVPTFIAVIVVLMTKPTYRSEAMVNPPASLGGSPFSEAFKDAGGSAGGLLSSVLGGGMSSKGLNDCINILESIQFGRLIIQKFDLEKEYKFKGPDGPKKYYFADVHKVLQKHIGYMVTEEDAIQLYAKHSSPETARDMVSFMIHLLDSLYIDMQRTETKHRLEYVDRRLEQAEKDMRSMEDSLIRFQGKHNLLEPEAQVRMILVNAAQTEMKIETLKEAMELEAALRGTSSSRYRDLKIEKDLLQNTLARQMRNDSDPNSLILPAKTLPALSTEYFRLERAYAIRLGVYKYLVQQVEGLKLNADRDVQVISVIDPPWVNDKRVAPKRRIIVEAVFFISLLLSSSLAIFLTLWSRHKEEHPESGRQFAEIRRSLLRWR